MKTADFIMFMGQSNMAGRGITCEKWPQNAPEVIPGAGYEFRAVTDPSKLYPLDNTFGRNENTEYGINDAQKKTGSMVCSFVNAYYEGNGNIPAVGVSASKGGSGIGQWQPGEPFLEDAIRRMKAALDYLEGSGIDIRHKFMVWCQGETDGDIGTSEEQFKNGFRNMFERMKQEGIEKLFMVLIGNCNIPGSEDRYVQVQKWERELACEEDVILVSDEFVSMREKGLMKDKYHYYQQGYNICGETAGRNTARYYVP